MRGLYIAMAVIGIVGLALMALFPSGPFKPIQVASLPSERYGCYGADGTPLFKIDASHIIFVRQQLRIAYQPTRDNLGVGILPKSAVVSEYDQNGRWAFRTTSDRPLILRFEQAGVLGISDARSANIIDNFTPMPCPRSNAGIAAS